MSNTTTTNYISELQEKVHRAISPFLSEEPVAVIDFPNIRNVGDSAIWLGEMNYLRSRLNKTPAYVSMRINFSDIEFRKRAPRGALFLQGGGTFGDVWDGHHDFRVRLLERCVDRTIIQFPQSIHYSSPSRVDEMARAIAKHKNFILLLRDEESKHFAEKHFDCQVILCPDMAFCIGPVQARVPSMPLLAMLRDDREKASSREDASGFGLPVEDWIFTERKMAVRIAKLGGVLRALPSLDPMAVRLGKYNAAARQRFGRGVCQLERAKVIVTDRLHVHIVSLLLGRPHAVLDNSYGKITRFMEAFPGGGDLTYRATSLTDAVEWARARATQLDGDVALDQAAQRS